MTFFEGFKKQITEIPKEAEEVFNACQKVMTPQSISDGLIDWDKFIEKHNVADNSLKNFLKDTNYAEKTLENYKSYLESTAQSTSKFGTAMKTLGNIGKAAFVTLGNMAAIYAVSKGIEILINKWQEYANVQEDAIERGNQSLSKMQENQEKLTSAQELLNELNSNTVTLDDGTVVTHFEQLSKGVNSLGQNVSLTTDEFAEYNSILEQLTETGFSATGSMANLEQQFANMRTSANYDTLTGLKDWVDGFNAKNNQDYIDSTKEVGLQQQISALKNITGTDIKEVETGSFLDNLFSNIAYVNTLQAASGLVNEDISKEIYKQADEIREANLELQTNTEAYKKLAEDFDLDIFDDKGNISTEKLNTDEVQSQIEQATKTLEAQVESSVRESAGYFQALFETNPYFDKVSEAAQETISGIFENIDYDTITTMMDEDGNLSQAKMRKWINGLTYNLSKADIQSQFDELFTLNTKKSGMTFKDYQKQADSLIKSISSAVPELSSDLLRNASGVDDVIEDLQGSYQKVADLFGSKNANKLNLDDLEIAANIIGVDGFSGTFDELERRIAQSKQSLKDFNDNPIFDSIADADESKNAGADYVQAKTYLEEAKEMYDKGLVGTDDFKRRAAYLSPTESDDAANFIENYSKAARYLTDDSSGVQEFLSDLEKKGYASLKTMSDGTKQWSYDIADLNTAANDMGMGFEFFIDMFGRLEDYGFHNNFVNSVEDGASRITELAGELASEQSKLAQMEIDHDLGLVNDTALDAQREKVKLLEQDILQTQDVIDQLSQKTADDFEQQIEKNKQSMMALKEERDKILEEDRYGENTQAVVDMMDEEIQRLASESHLTLDADLNIVNEDEIESTLSGLSLNLLDPIGVSDDVLSRVAEQYNISSNRMNAEPFSFNLNTESIDEINTQIEAVKTALSSLQDENGIVNIETQGAQDAIQVLEALYAQKLQVTGRIVMSVDTSQLESDTATVISLLQQFETASAELSALNDLKSANVSVDTSEAEAQLDNVIGQIQNLNGSQAEIMAKIVPDTSSVDSIQNAISSINVDNLLKIGIDTSAIDGYDPEEKDSRVNYVADFSKVNRVKAPQKNGTVSYTAIWNISNPPKKTQYVDIVTRTHSGKNGNFATGTLLAPSHVNGTAYNVLNYQKAFANGSIALDKNQDALVNEMGTESIIRGNEWFLIPGGIHVQALKKGDIVLNAKQTKDLIESGKAAGHGKAYAAGSGGGSFVGGTSSSSKSSSSSSSSTNKNTTAVNKNTAATNSNTSAIEDTKDWIAVKLDRLAHSLDEFTNLASNYYTGYIKQNEQLNKAISQAQTNINENSAAYWHYMNSADSLGLSSDYKERIKNGQFNIETITDENLKDKVEKYQEWYEAAQACRDTIIDLNAQLKELGNQKLDNIVDDYDSFVGVTESIYNNYETANQLLEAQGKSASKFALQIMLEQRNNAADRRRAELQQLRQEEENLVNSGVITKWSQEWYELEGKIHDVQAEINSATAEAYELRQQIREVNWKDFTDGIEAIDTLNDNLENTLSLIDDMESFAQNDSLLNANGILKLGLYGKQLGNARQAVEDYEYAIETLNKELAMGNVTQEQYDEQLKELNEGRWEAVSSVKKYRDSILELVKDGINKETEAMQKLVDARKEALSKQKEYYDWNKKVQDQNKQINAIEAQIQALQGDDSLEAQSKLRKLQSQKQELEDELKESQIEREYDIVSEGYDNMMEEFEQNQEDELYLLNSSLDAQNQAIDNMLSKACDSYQVVYDELGNIAETYGMKLSDDLTNPWKTAQDAVASYKKAVEELQANVSINTSGVTPISNNSSIVNYAESSPSVPDNNVQQNYNSQAAQQAQQSSTAGMVSNIGATLKNGSRGQDVSNLQTALNALGYNAGKVDGIFGSNTEAAVRRFQQATGIAVDGVVGKDTKAQFRARGYKKGVYKSPEGLALTDEEGEGTEFIITPKGVMRQLDSGSTVFSNPQVQRLWDISNGKVVPADWVPNVPTMPDLSQHLIDMIQPREIKSGDVNVHYDSLLTVNGDIDKDTFPGVQKMCDKACNYTVKFLREQQSRLR